MNANCDGKTPKNNIFETAQSAEIVRAKRTSDPLLSKTAFSVN
jgi:molybdenum cofactor biosynthesis enzyme